MQGLVMTGVVALTVVIVVVAITAFFCFGGRSCVSRDTRSGSNTSPSTRFVPLLKSFDGNPLWHHRRSESKPLLRDSNAQVLLYP